MSGAVLSAEEACDNPVYPLIGDGDKHRRALAIETVDLVKSKL